MISYIVRTVINRNGVFDMNASPHTSTPGKLLARVEDVLFVVTLVVSSHFVTVGYLYIGALLEQAV